MPRIRHLDIKPACTCDLSFFGSLEKSPGGAKVTATFPSLQRFEETFTKGAMPPAERLTPRQVQSLCCLWVLVEAMVMPLFYTYGCSYIIHHIPKSRLGSILLIT